MPSTSERVAPGNLRSCNSVTRSCATPFFGQQPSLNVLEPCHRRPRNSDRIFVGPVSVRSHLRQSEGAELLKDRFEAQCQRLHVRIL